MYPKNYRANGVKNKVEHKDGKNLNGELPSKVASSVLLANFCEKLTPIGGKTRDIFGILFAIIHALIHSAQKQCMPIAARIYKKVHLFPHLSLAKK